MQELDCDPTVPVVMSLWQRLPLLDRMLYQLSTQERVRPKFFLLNNNQEIHAEVQRIVKKYESKLPIQVTQSDNSLACLGRFVHARRIKNGYPFMVFIDDDQEFNRTFLRTLWDERTPGGATGCHAYSFLKNHSYWKRGRLTPGNRAHYCGPGGMILDTRLLDRPELYRGPKQSHLMDDLWFSFVLNHVVQTPLYKSSAKVQMRDFKNDTFLRIYQEKIDFLEHLRNQGWRV